MVEYFDEILKKDRSINPSTGSGRTDENLICNKSASSNTQDIILFLHFLKTHVLS